MSWDVAKTSIETTSQWSIGPESKWSDVKIIYHWNWVIIFSAGLLWYNVWASMKREIDLCVNASV